MQIRILGPIEVATDADVLALGGPKPRTVLAVLALHHGEVVSPDVLIEAVWGDHLPKNPQNALQYQIAQLRKVLESDPSAPVHLVTRSKGYVLDANTTALDATEFTDEVLNARSKFTVGDFVGAGRSISTALAFWRGSALGEFSYEEFAVADATRLDAEHLAAEELRIDIALAQGRHAEVVPTLAKLTMEHPTREGLWARRMTALYRNGSQTDALRVYQQARQSLTEIGIEASSELRDLEQQILDQDPDLTPVVAGAPQHLVEGNIPTPPNRLIGRDAEVAAVSDQLMNHRLVTLIGTGGAGKTRLALEVARSTSDRYRDGTWLVRLDRLDSPELLTSFVGQAIGMRENPELDILDNLVDHMDGREALIVLDNCEHMADAAATFTSVFLERASTGRVLATSQVTLGVQGEAVHEVRPLTLPGESGSIFDRLDDVAAITLFLDRAAPPGASGGTWSDDDLAAIANIVTALDGVPLAIELAAARTRSMSLIEIARGLTDPTAFLARGSSTAPVRQQSLAAVVEWSLQLLDPSQRTKLLELSVFVGGFDADSAASIIDSSEIDTRELLATFVDRSLLLRLDNLEGAARYRMLETLRQYCMGQLDEQSLTTVRDSHLAIFDRFVDSASAGIFGADQLSWLRRLDAEYENVRAALAWTVEGGSVETGLRIGANLGRWWDWKGLLKEASEWLGQLSDAATGACPGLSDVLAWRAFLQWEFGDIESATQLISQASDASQAVGDPEDGLTMLSIRALISRSTKDLDNARQDCIDLAIIGNATGNPWAEAWAHSTLATIDLTSGDLEPAEVQAQTAVEMFRELGDVRGEGWGLVSTAQAAFGKKDLDRADRLARDALAASTTAMDHRTTSWVLELLAEIAIERGNAERAAILLGAAYPLLRHRGLTSSASKRDDLDNVETTLRHDLGERFSDLFATGSSDPDSVVSEELAISGTDPTH
ncbi:MAG: winged helix-turn-helix domain-containing protein [Actinomycetia bacterium]|nr:winged helix-turn-helix domain-containing protein [Actinomycetes bacterium]